MSVIWSKIWSDLWHNKGRTIQVVAIIAMGAFAIGMIIGSRNLFQARIGQSWRASSPAMIDLAVEPAVDDVMITSLESIKGVHRVEGFQQTTLEWRLSPGEPWRPGGLIARADYEDQHYNKLHLLSGQWPKHKIVAVEKGSDAYFGLAEGSQVYIRLNNRDYAVQIGGVIANLTVLPPGLGGPAQFYITRDRLGDLTGERNFNRILAGASVYEEKVVLDVADRMQSRLEKQDIEVSGAAPPQDNPQRVADPDTYFAQQTIDGLFLILGIMAALALLLGLILVYNTITALISQQINQIGMMKAIGARTGQILFIYLANTFVYGLLALLIAAPLGAIGAYSLNVFMADVFNVNPGPFTISSPALLAQVAVALLSPLLAALGPIFAGARITVREAISTYGLGATANLLDRLLARVNHVSRLILLAISNTFRNSGRVWLTQVTLVGSGLIFMMIISVKDSVAYTFGDVLFSILRFNLTFQFEEPERIEAVEALTLAYPGVKAVEMWGLSTPKTWPATRPESEDDQAAQLFGVPLPTRLYGPQLRGGRWLQPGDSYAVVLNQNFAAKVGVGVGDKVIFDHGPHGESEWVVVGLLFDPILTQSAYAPRETLLHEIRSFNRASTIWIQTVHQDAAGEAAMAQNLRTYYESRKLKLNSQGLFFGRDTASQIAELIFSNFGIIVVLLATMAVIIGLVGAVALSGVLSLSVLERRREIGVLRAIGASSAAIAGLFVGEGLILGLLSWLIALPLSIPASYIFTTVLGVALGNEIIYQYTPAGALLWLGVITVLSILASWLPARSATQLSVQESLAYQ